MAVNRLGLQKPKRYKKLVKHKRRPRQETRSFSKNGSYVSKVNDDGTYIKRSRLNGKRTRYTKTGRVSKNQNF
jgi:hypothetical protein